MKRLLNLASLVTRPRPPVGTTPSDVNRLVKQFAEMQKMMKRFGMAGMGKGKKGRKRGGGGLPGLPPGGMPDLAELTGGLPGGGFPGLPQR